MRFPILSGRLRGWWWLVTTPGKTVRVLSGSYEPENTRIFESLLQPGATVVDVGAHAGYYTLLSAGLVAPGGDVHAFEPNPRNVEFLRRHVRINRLSSLRIEAAAVADVDGMSRFRFGTGSGTGRLGEDGTIEVPTVTLDSYCDRHQLEPTLIKIDVEGAELRVLRGAVQTLEHSRPIVVLSTHGPEVHRECLAFLRQRGYSIEAIGDGEVDETDEVLCLPA